MCLFHGRVMNASRRVEQGWRVHCTPPMEYVTTPRRAKGRGGNVPGIHPGVTPDPHAHPTLRRYGKRLHTASPLDLTEQEAPCAA